MKIGYIHINRDEQSKVMQVLNLLTEPTALDELGIGRIRDAFSNKMFPGTSTLQKHAKYFSLMPQLYLRATQKKYNRISEVKAEVIRLEKIMTAALCKGSPDATGITGKDMIKSSDYVKYDPAYIYNSGLFTFEILNEGSLYELIYSASKHLHESPERLKNEDEDKGDDANELGNYFQFCSCPSGIEYDFTTTCNLTLTPADIRFIKEHILKAKATQDTLLKYLIEHEDFPLEKFEKFEDLDETLLPTDLKELLHKAQTFANFIYLAHLRYNWIFSKGTDEDMKAEFIDCYTKYRANIPNIDYIVSGLEIREKSGISFCKNIVKCLNADDNFKSLDQLIIKREKDVKGSRNKLGSKQVYDKEHRIHHYRLNYRWDTVKTIVKEIRGMEVTNG